MAIVIFCAPGTLAGGAVSPWLWGTLIGTGSRTRVFHGYALGAGLMISADPNECAWERDMKRLVPLPGRARRS